MKRSRRSDGHKAFTRPMNLLKKGLRRLSRAGALAGAAGEPGFDFERLEERQLLFTLTIDTQDPALPPGYGSAGALFAYFLPTLFNTAVPQTAQPTITTEDFNRNVPANPGAFPNT